MINLEAYMEYTERGIKRTCPFTLDHLDEIRDYSWEGTSVTFKTKDGIKIANNAKDACLIAFQCTKKIARATACARGIQLDPENKKYWDYIYNASPDTLLTVCDYTINEDKDLCNNIIKKVFNLIEKSIKERKTKVLLFFINCVEEYNSFFVSTMDEHYDHGFKVASERRLAGIFQDYLNQNFPKEASLFFNEVRALQKLRENILFKRKPFNSIPSLALRFPPDHYANIYPEQARKYCNAKNIFLTQILKVSPAKQAC